MSAQAPVKNRMLRTALLSAGIVVWQIYELASATEAPSQSVLTLHYILLALGAISLAGALIVYLRAD